jgi:hypothetical protein
MAAALCVAIVSAGCEGEDRPQVEVIGGGGFVSISGADDSAGGGQSGIRYTTSTNQDLAFQAALDLRDIRSVINVAIDGRPVEWQRAIDVYEKGKNQRRDDGSVRSLAALAVEDMQAAFPRSAQSDASSVDSMIRAGLNGTGRGAGLSDDARRQLVDSGILLVLCGQAVQAFTDAKVRVDANQPAAGAAVDEAWGYIAGATDSEGARRNSLLQLALDQEAAFKLNGKIARPLEAAFITALAAAVKGDAAAFNTYFAEANGELNAIFYLATLHTAQLLEGDSSATARLPHLIEGEMYFQAIRAAVAEGSPDSASTVHAVFTRAPSEPFTAAETESVYRALNEPAVLRALGVPVSLQVKTRPAAQ